MSQRKFLTELLKDLSPNQDNLHLIAISNLKDFERQTIRWWCKKYRTPQKPLGDHTLEELYIEKLEDYYESRPEEAQRFLESVYSGERDDWGGFISEEYEAKMEEFWKKKKPVDLSKYQGGKELTEKEEKELIANLGKNLKKSSVKKGKIPTLGDDEFEDIY